MRREAPPSNRSGAAGNPHQALKFRTVEMGWRRTLGDMQKRVAKGGEPADLVVQLGCLCPQIGARHIRRGANHSAPRATGYRRWPELLIARRAKQRLLHSRLALSEAKRTPRWKQQVGGGRLGCAEPLPTALWLQGSRTRGLGRHASSGSLSSCPACQNVLSYRRHPPPAIFTSETEFR